MVARIKRFIEEALNEFRHVNWPTPQEAVRLTGVVIGISLSIALFLGFFDYVFTALIKLSITH